MFRLSGRLASACLAAVLAGASLLPGTSVQAAQYGSKYFEGGVASCTSLTCSLRLSAVPVGKYVLIDRVSCKILSSVSGGTVPPLVVVETGYSLTPTGTVAYSRGGFLAPFDVVYFTGPGRTYSLNAATNSIILAGERPVVTATFASTGATPGLTIFLQCHVFGQISNPPV